MTVNTPATTLTDDELRDALAHANYPTLLLVLFHLTGDAAWLEEPFVPTRPPGMSIHDSGDLAEEVQGRIREAAFAAVRAYLRGTPAALPHPDRETFLRMASVSLGEALPEEYEDLIVSMFDEQELSQAASRLAEVAPTAVRVLIVGAGASGLCAGVRLDQAGVEWTILERSEEVGGTWWENRYPGCGVDTPSHLYSFSFAPRDWTRYFARRDELESYFEDVADEWKLRDRIRFGTTVVEARWHEDDACWHVSAVGPDGGSEEYRAEFLVSAVGAFGTPVLPDIPGLSDFGGDVVHTARWDDDVVLDGKRVGVIGSGASAMQVVTSVADLASRLTIFQRTPQWVSPLEPSFAGAIPPSVRKLIVQVPFYRPWLRIREAWLFNDRAHPATTKEPGWRTPDVSLGEANERLRLSLTRYVGQELAGRDDLVAGSIPDYPPFGKRMLMDHGWYEVLRRPDVTLTGGAVRVTPTAVVSADGEAHELDAVILATGFDVVRFLSSYEVYGSSGERLRDVWDDDDAKAYLGLCVPGFPNFFTLYGPNTQAGHGGSLLFAIEAQVDYILTLLADAFADGADTVEVRREAYEDYARRVDEAHQHMVWTHPKVSTYYRNSRGRVVVNSPWRVVEFWRLMRRLDRDAFVMSRRAGGVGER